MHLTFEKCILPFKGWNYHILCYRVMTSKRAAPSKNIAAKEVKMLYFVLLTICEIAFVIWFLLKAQDNNQFYLGRLILRAGEIVAVLLAMLITKDSLGMRNVPILMLLFVLWVYSLIRWLVQRKNVEARKKPAKVIITRVLGLLLFALALVPAFVFANYKGLPTTGEYAVKTADGIWVDENRLEKFENDGSYREVPVHFYYPDASGDKKFPLVIFSHGAFGYYQSNNSTYCELASRGYVVVSLDHPYHSFFTKDSDGKMITVNQKFINDVMMINNEDVSEDIIYSLSSEWLELRNADINFVIDYIEDIRNNNVTDSNLYEAVMLADNSNIGLMGHSLGGAAAVAIGRNRPEVKAVIDLDGTMLGEQVYVDGKYDINSDPYPLPLLVVSNDEHHNAMDDEGLLYVNNVVLENAVNAREVYFKNSGHMNFTDLPLFSPFLSSMLGTGSIDAKSCIEQMNGMVCNFFDYYLKGTGELQIEECYE